MIDNTATLKSFPNPSQEISFVITFKPNIATISNHEIAILYSELPSNNLNHHQIMRISKMISRKHW